MALMSHALVGVSPRKVSHTREKARKADWKVELQTSRRRPAIMRSLQRTDIR